MHWLMKDSYTGSDGLRRVTRFTPRGWPRGAGYGLSDAGWHEYWKDNAAITASK